MRVSGRGKQSLAVLNENSSQKLYFLRFSQGNPRSGPAPRFGFSTETPYPFQHILIRDVGGGEDGGPICFAIFNVSRGYERLGPR